MSFEIEWDKKAISELRKFPKDLAARIVSKVDDLKDNPLRYIEKLVGVDAYKLRVGDYRVFVDLYFNPNKIVIRSMKHRSVAYKR